MKNMTLPAKSCRRNKFSLYSVLCILSVLAVSFAGCKKDSEKEPNNPQPQTTLYGSVARPAWTAPEKFDPTSSMTAVVKVDLKAQYPDLAADFVLNDNDLIAAFAGETCLGVAPPDEGLFYLYITLPLNSEALNSEAIILKYYSAHYKNLFEAKDAFPFKKDDILGTIANPYIPSLAVVK